MYLAMGGLFNERVPLEFPLVSSWFPLGFRFPFVFPCVVALWFLLELSKDCFNMLQQPRK